MKLHHHPASSASGPLMLFATGNGVPLQMSAVDPFKGEQKEVPGEAVDPNHVVPALNNGDLRLTESSAIRKGQPMVAP